MAQVSNSVPPKPVKVPKSVQEMLSPGEQIVDKLSISSQDFYATTQRIIAFRKSEMWFLLGWLWYLMAQKKYAGSMEYSKISNISLVSYRSKGLTALALILVLIFLYFAILFFTLEGAEPVGVFFLAMGIIFGALLGIRKVKYYQIENSDLNKKELGKWRIPAIKAAGKFVTKVKELSGGK